MVRISFNNLRFDSISSATRMLAFSNTMFSVFLLNSSVARISTVAICTFLNNTVKTHPSPSVVLTVISPFMASTSLLLIAKPSPVPPYFLVSKP
ncbi:MAG: hypothetical protein ACD_79C00656G0001, partial [uncultured bacterium]